MSNSYGRSLMLGGSLTQGSFTNRIKKPTELMLVPMIDIFTVLVTFLLMTAVFSRITILQLDLPSSDSASAGTPPEFRLEVIVRHQGFELTNGTKLIATIPKLNDQYDFDTLTQMAVSLKQEYPKANDASVLLERDVQYDYLIQSMDAIRTAEVKQADATTTKLELFANIAVGEAP